MTRHLLFAFAAAGLSSACADESRTDDRIWAINGTKSGVFDAMKGFVQCSLNSSAAFGPSGPHATFDIVFDEHPEVGFLFFEFVPLPDPQRGQRTLTVGRLGLFSHVKDLANGDGFYQDVVGRMEGSLGKVVPHRTGKGAVRELFLHHVVLPEQMLGTPDGRTFALSGRLSDVRLYCEDFR